MYCLEELGKSTFGFERTAVSNFESKRHMGSGDEIGSIASQKIRDLHKSS